MTDSIAGRGLRRAVIADGLARPVLQRVWSFSAEDQAPVLGEIVRSLVASMPPADARDLVVELAKATLRKGSK